MASSVSTYPTSLDTTTIFPDPTGVELDGDGNANLVHSTQHNSLAAALIQVETLLGITGAFNASKTTRVVTGPNAPTFATVMADATADGVADEVQIQAELDAMTASRTHYETLTLIGDFVIADTVRLDPFTILDLSQATITAAGSLNDNMIANKVANRENPATDSRIKIIGGIIDGNKANNTSGDGINMRRVSYGAILGTEIRNCKDRGLVWSGVDANEGGSTTTSERGTFVVLNHINAHDNGSDGIYVNRAMRRSMIDSCNASRNGGNGFFIDASEVHGSVNQAFGNAGHGLKFTNGSTQDLGTFICMANGQAAAYSRGLVRAHLKVIGGQNWQSGYVVPNRYQWTASGSGTNEYYLQLASSGDPGITRPFFITDNGESLNPGGTLGSLAAEGWAWGDNDSLGFNTVYVRLSGGGDPDSRTMRFNFGPELIFDTPTSNHGENDRVEFEFIGHEDTKANGIHFIEDGPAHVEDFDLNTGYQWTASAQGTNEYYLEMSGGGDPAIWDPTGRPGDVADDAANLTEQNVPGGLSAGQWAFGDNDGLGFDTVYVRLSDNSDPDSSVMTSDGIQYPDQSAHAVWLGDTNDGDIFSEGVGGSTALGLIFGKVVAETYTDGEIRHPYNDGIGTINIELMRAVGSNWHPVLFGKEITVQSSNFSVASTGRQSVTVAHGLLMAPGREDVRVSVLDVSGDMDWQWGSIFVDSTDTTNVTIDINVTTAQAGANGKLSLYIKISPETLNL